MRPHEARTARAILVDKRLDRIVGMARTLLSTGITAGSSYPEVWIRDLNTFIEVGLQVTPSQEYRAALRRFFLFQGPTGDIADGYVPSSGAVARHYRTSPEAPGLFGHKNSVEVDQESSLVQAVARYVNVTGDKAFLTEVVNDQTVARRLERALEWVMAERWSAPHGLVWAATKIDWGDVQPENNPGDQIDAATHPAIGVYDNAFFVIAADTLATLLADEQPRSQRWREVARATRANLRRHLWRGSKLGFLPHLYLGRGSPFPKDFDEASIYYFGGTGVAIEAGVLRPDEFAPTLHRMEELARQAGAGSIGLTVYPAYRTGLFANPNVRTAYTYQNGGDWDWFGARTVRALTERGMAADAYRVFGPMLDRTLAEDGFYEWWTLDGRPEGSAGYRGSAGVMASAAQALQSWARDAA